MKQKLERCIAHLILLAPLLLVAFAVVAVPAVYALSLRVSVDSSAELHEEDNTVLVERDEPAEMENADKPIGPATVLREEAGPAATAKRPFTAGEEVMLAKLLYAEARGVSGEKWGVSGQARQAAVIWCVLNRVDDGTWGGSIAEVVTYPYQFAYDPDTPVDVGLMNLAYDVLCRWETEKGGEATVGRVLPKEYLYFGAEYGENYFRTEYDKLGENWDWRLPDPYKES